MILVGEMRDKETIETALEAAETGILVLSTLHTIDAAKTVERIVGVFPLGDQQPSAPASAECSASSSRSASSPKLTARPHRRLEILKSTMRTREYVSKGESESRSIVDAMKAGDTEGMQTFEWSSSA